MGTKAKREVDPPRDEYSAEVTVGYQTHVASVKPFFVILPMVFANLCYDGVDPGLHLFDTFPPGAPIIPDRPCRILVLDFRGQKALVITVIPFAYFFSDDMVRCFDVSK